MESNGGDPRITVALAQMAMFRQAEVGDVTLDLYSAQLTAEAHPIEDVITACDRHAQAERREGESAFPAIGQLRRLIYDVAVQRESRQRLREQEERRLLQPPQVSASRAKIWLDRMKFTAKNGGTLEDAARAFPFPDEAADVQN